MKVPEGGPAISRCCSCCRTSPGDAEESSHVEEIVVSNDGATRPTIYDNPYYQVEQEADYCPYVGELKDLKQGNIITIVGTALHACERFTINLFCYGQEGALKDLALHFNPRLSQHYVVRTSRLNGKWGQEETTSVSPFPFVKEEVFTIDIFVGSTSFFVQVNSKHFCEFDFRIPLARICGIEVKGLGVNIHEVKIGEVRSYPTKVPGTAGPPYIPTDENVNLLWSNPAIGVLKNGFRQGQQVVIVGRVKLLPHSFYVNFQSSVQLWPHPDVAFHINPRFMAGKKHTIICNTWQQGSWGEEERTETSHMFPGTVFKLQICCEDKYYSIWLSDKLVGVYSFRMKPEIVKAILIQGDIYIYKIYQNDMPNNMLHFDDEEFS